MMKGYYLSALLLSLKIETGETSQCNIVNGEPGMCVPLKSCNPVMHLIRNLQKPLPKDVSLLIQESFLCNSHGSPGVGVCCPLQGPPQGVVTAGKNTCKFQDGGPGTCVGYTQCHPFVKLLENMRKPLPLEVPSLIKEVFLCGFEMQSDSSVVPKICCPNEALLEATPGKKVDQADTESTTKSSHTASTSGDTTFTTTERSTTTEKPTHPILQHSGIAAIGNLDTCGRSLVIGRIVGGRDTVLGQYPWLANIGYSVSNSDEIQYNCGGTLIGSLYVLTAAHCVTNLPKSYSFSRVRLGEHNLANAKADCDQQNFCAHLPQDYDPVDVIIHPQYNKPNRFNNDIALIKLDRAIVETDFVSPICLPIPTVYDVPQEVRMPEVAGWGATDIYARRFSDILQYASVPFFPFEDCTEIYKRQRVQLVDSQMCAGGKKGTDSCSGDSGSGLMVEIEPPSRPYDPRWIQLGIVSFGPRRCASEGVPGVYTNVSAYIPWILDTVEDH